MDEVTPVRTVPAKRHSFWLSKKFLLILVAIIAVLLVWFFFIREEAVPGADQTKTATLSGQTISYPGNWQPTTINDSEKKKSVIFKLYSRQPVGSFIWRSSKGRLDKSVDVNALPGLIANRLSKTASGAKVISRGVDRVGQYDVVKILYTRPDTTNPEISNRNLLYVIPRPNETYYLTFSARDDEYSRLESGFSQILNSVSRYIDSR